MKNQFLSSLCKEFLRQILGIQETRKGRIELNVFNKGKLKEAQITESELLYTFKYGEEQSPNKYVAEYKGFTFTVIAKPSGDVGWYELKACWKSKIPEWRKPKLYKSRLI